MNILPKSKRVISQIIRGLIKKSKLAYGKIQLKSIYIFSAYRKTPGKVNLSDIADRNYGKHRSGWSFAIYSIRSLHNPRGMYVDSFIERSFVWSHKGVKPHMTDWVGFIHVPPAVPDWFQLELSNKAIMNTEAWKLSYPQCKGLFTLSAYHKNSLKSYLDVPIENLFHPTEFPALTWSWERFNRNKEKKIVQVGYWLRKLYSIYLLQGHHYQKVFLRANHPDLDKFLKAEYENSAFKHLLTEDVMQSTQILSFLSNKKYDELLSENIVFLDLYDASANNAVIECIARNTPILVNKIEPVVEYLGEEYPFYFSSLEEAAAKVCDEDLIIETHQYLVNHPFKYKYTVEYFKKCFIDSQICQSIHI